MQDGVPFERQRLVRRANDKTRPSRSIPLSMQKIMFAAPGSSAIASRNSDNFLLVTIYHNRIPDFLTHQILGEG